jgi:hypothetical protein
MGDPVAFQAQMDSALNQLSDRLQQQFQRQLSQQSETHNQQLKQQSDSYNKQLKQQIDNHNHQMSLMQQSVKSLKSEFQSNVDHQTKSTQSQLKPEFHSTFNGLPHESIDNWLYEVESYFVALNVGDSETESASKVAFVKAQMRGTAKAWLKFLDDTQAEESQINIWPEFKILLNRRFQPVAAHLLARAQLRQLVQIGSVSDYIQRFLSIINQIPNMHDDERLDRFLNGLKPFIKREMGTAAYNLKTFNDAVDFAQKAEICVSSASEFSRTAIGNRTVSNQQNSNTNSNRSNLIQQNRPFNNSSQSNANSSFNNKINWSNDTSRMNNSVPPVRPVYQPNANISQPMQIDRIVDSRTCFNCKRQGHWARDCRQLKQRLNALLTLQNSQNEESVDHDFVSTPKIQHHENQHSVNQL